MHFQPPRVYVLEGLWENADAARRAERIIQAQPKAAGCIRFVEDVEALEVVFSPAGSAGGGEGCA